MINQGICKNYAILTSATNLVFNSSNITAIKHFVQTIRLLLHE